MSTIRTPRGITPPTPGLDREEPTFVPEQDLPEAEGTVTTRGERVREDNPAVEPEPD
jgi:hypothetical protein